MTIAWIDRRHIALERSQRERRQLGKSGSSEFLGKIGVYGSSHSPSCLAPMTLRFRSRIEINKINPYVLVRADQAARLKSDWRRPMPVRVQVNGKPDTPWRINLMPVGDGDFFLYLHGHVRKASGTSVGDTVSVTLAFDDDYKGGPAHPMPPWFGLELDRHPKAKKGWAKLTPSRQKEILRYFAGLKSPAAQERNVGRALHVLAGGRARFMAREWNADRSE